MGAVIVLQLIFTVGVLSFGWQIAIRGEYTLVRGYKKGAEHTARAVGTLLLAGGILSLCALPPLMYFAPHAALPALAAVAALTLIPVCVLVRKIK